MEKYTEPELTVIAVDVEDVVKTSNGDNDGTYIPGTPGTN